MEKGFTITYEYGGNLYVNTTNRCDFNCTFCLRHNAGGGSIYTHNLWLTREPTREEILQSIEDRDLSPYGQLVFCGFGEPSYRIEDICWVIDRLKEHGKKIFTRMDTNGTGNLIHGRNICPDFKGRFDMVSISLNTDTAEKYDALCVPQVSGAFEAMLREGMNKVNDVAKKWVESAEQTQKQIDSLIERIGEGETDQEAYQKEMTARITKLEELFEDLYRELNGSSVDAAGIRKYAGK